MGSHGSRSSLRRPWEVGISMAAWQKPCIESLEKIKAKDAEPFRNGSVHEFYRLKALITLEEVITSVAGKNKNLNAILRRRG